MTDVEAAILRPPAPSAGKKKKSLWIASPAFDLTFFVLSPVLALGLAFLLRGDWIFTEFTINGGTKTRFGFFIATWTYAHLFAVFFRSHGNSKILSEYRFRFLAAPVLIAAGMYASEWLLATGMVLAVFWDVYHSAMQNFGFCRIYDVRAGNPPERGRSLDWALNLVLYILPIFLGASLKSHLSALGHFSRVQWRAPTQFADWLLSVQATVGATAAFFGLLFLVYYAYCYAGFIRKGHRLAMPKILMILSVGIVTTSAWALLPPIAAYFVVNFYHGLQYFAVVWWFERSNMMESLDAGPPVAFLVFTVSVFALGFSYVIHGDRYDTMRLIGCGFLTVSLLHFWYDSFIWSVRKKQV